MFTPKENNFAFIDSNNLYLGVKDQGRKLDFVRFRKFKNKIEKQKRGIPAR